MTIHGVTAPWAESLVSWNNFAGAYSPAVSASLVPVQAMNYVDVTALAQGWAGPGAVNHGLLLAQATGLTTLYSSEGDPADRRPALSLCYLAPGY